MKYVLFWASLLLPCFSVAQQIEGALLVGANASQFTGDSFGGFDKLGWQIGGGVSLPFSKKIAIRPEIVLHQKGSRSRRNEPYYKWRATYVDMSFLLGYRAGERWLLVGGPSVNYLVSGREDRGQGFEDRTDQLRPFDVAGMIGATYNIAPMLGIGARFAHSFTTFGEANDLRHQVLALHLQYTLQPGR